MYEATERLYLTADGRVCHEGDPEAATLLIAPGQLMSDEDAEKYGLKAVKEAPEDKAVEPSEDKAFKFPTATKRAKGAKKR